MARTVEEQEPWTHPWASQSRRFPEDVRLRAFGFTIADRPRGGPDLWADPQGDTYTVPEALSLVDKRVDALVRK